MGARFIFSGALAARALGLPGMSPDTVRGFRDKELMKERVRAAGLRVPRSRRVRTEREVREGAEAIGLPLILKPIAGAGSADTYAVRTPAELNAALQATRGVPGASCEEYVERAGSGDASEGSLRSASSPR